MSAFLLARRHLREAGAVDQHIGYLTRVNGGPILRMRPYTDIELAAADVEVLCWVCWKWHRVLPSGHDRGGTINTEEAT